MRVYGAGVDAALAKEGIVAVNMILFDFPSGYWGYWMGIGNFVWNDLNHNGIQDAGEPGLMGVKVYLKVGNAVVDTQITDVNGHYQFSSKCAGDYTVEIDGSTVPAVLMRTDPARIFFASLCAVEMSRVQMLAASP